MKLSDYEVSVQGNCDVAGGCIPVLCGTPTGMASRLNCGYAVRSTEVKIPTRPRGDAFSGCEPEHGGRVLGACPVVIDCGGDVGPACLAHESDGKVAQGGHGTGCGTSAYS